MTLPTGTNCLTEAEDAIRLMLSECAACQTFVGEATAEAARDHIYVGAVDPPTDGEAYTDVELQALLAHILIATAIEDGFKLRLISHPTGFAITGSVELKFKAYIDSDDSADPEKFHRTFQNSVGDIIEEITDQLEIDGGLQLTDITGGGPYQLAEDEETIEPYLTMDVVMSWGVPEE